MSEVHVCEMPDCNRSVSFDDEPFCFKDSSVWGSSVDGYSYKELHARPNRKLPLDVAFEIIAKRREYTAEEVAILVGEFNNNGSMVPGLKVYLDAVLRAGFKIVRSE